jgi:IS30 family transposase
MGSKNHTTVQAERRRGQHLGPEERGAIKTLKKQGFGVRAISRAIGCAPSTVTNELERGTPLRRKSPRLLPEAGGGRRSTSPQSEQPQAPQGRNGRHGCPLG